MNAFVLIIVLAAPFVLLGALIWWLTLSIGRETSRSK
jgi:hypothetical protein